VRFLVGCLSPSTPACRDFVEPLCATNFLIEPVFRSTLHKLGVGASGPVCAVERRGDVDWFDVVVPDRIRPPTVWSARSLLSSTFFVVVGQLTSTYPSSKMIL
jgi:hypothetical protein